ncbi:hypothetical protein F5148DRAFT_811492 [Russula earlei]|uniref:Uncharacterized protein n=1 Tax=Russula earlei TaxID=71964 RepID=A0ACC0TSP5_9AGAM|nr:hypothetical protein F5148DRAFT_811492 [Russula earlei]
MSLGNWPHSTPIHILDDDSLLNMFYLSRPVLVNEAEDDDDDILAGGEWGRERWWYRVAQVCQRWRYLILGSASYLRLCFVCTYGVPVADMLAHSPPLPLILDYINGDHEITAEEEEGIMLALRHRNRVRRIRLMMPVANLQKLVAAIDDEFPMLEFLFVDAHTEGGASSSLTLPEAFCAPCLCHFTSMNFNLPLGSPLLATSVALVTLSLQWIPPFRPNELLQRLSLMPQLETLGIHCYPPLLTRDIERELFGMAFTAHATLPNLRWFGFGGANAYLEALLSHITTPLLEKLQIFFYVRELTFSVPHLLQFLSATRDLRLRSAEFVFDDSGVAVKVYPRKGAKMYSLYMDVPCQLPGLQVSSLAEIFDGLSPVFSEVKHLTFAYAKVNSWLGRYNGADRSEWRKLLRSFRNVRSLVVDEELMGEVSRCLRLEDGELPQDILPELKDLSYFGGSDSVDVFTGFINGRQAAGLPVLLVRR